MRGMSKKNCNFGNFFTGNSYNHFDPKGVYAQKICHDR